MASTFPAKGWEGLSREFLSEPSRLGAQAGFIQAGSSSPFAKPHIQSGFVTERACLGISAPCHATERAEALREQSGEEL